MWKLWDTRNFTRLYQTFCYVEATLDRRLIVGNQITDDYGNKRKTTGFPLAIWW
jgi:hypothetical protein